MTRRGLAGWALVFASASCRGCLDDPEDLAFDDGSPSGSTDAAASSPSSAADGSTSASSSTASVTSSGGGGDGGGAGGSASGPTSGTGGAPNCSDDFSPTWDMACWSLFNEPMAQITPDAGWLQISPAPYTGWWDPPNEEPSEDETGNGFFLYQWVTGDFVAAVRIEGSSTSGDYQMAGLLLRNDRRPFDPQEWVKWEIGRREVDVGSIGAVTDEADGSQWINGGAHAINGVDDAWLGACRSGDRVYLAYRLEAGSWTYAHTAGTGAAHHPDLDDEIQLGLMANAYDVESTVVARFDEFWFSPDTASDNLDCVDRLSALTQLSLK
jgi:regulation of enolase protein 1 (concanavalin A-like superfamily)